MTLYIDTPILGGVWGFIGSITVMFCVGYYLGKDLKKCKEVNK